ncbi:MAG TPA: DUF1294 domain-containing protein [Pseudoduganella sp.]
MLALPVADGVTLWQGVLALYATASVLCFIASGLDKRAAVRGAQRTPERTLLLLGLFGGWPGGLVAQHVFRHKTVKGSFLARFWVTVLLNLALLLLAAGQ